MRGQKDGLGCICSVQSRHLDVWITEILMNEALKKWAQLLSIKNSLFSWKSYNISFTDLITLVREASIQLIVTLHTLTTSLPGWYRIANRCLIMRFRISLGPQQVRKMTTTIMSILITWKKIIEPAMFSSTKNHRFHADYMTAFRVVASRVQ